MSATDTTSIPLWVELLKAIPSVVTAITAIIGVGIARAGLTKWRRETVGKRKTELAEEVLADFYQARDIIELARSPMGWGNEGSTRRRAEDETPDEIRMLDSYFRTVERLRAENDFFSKFYARRYRFKALFGPDAMKPFDELSKIRAEIIHASASLNSMYRQRDRGNMPAAIKGWEATIGWGVEPEDDKLAKRLESTIAEIEAICRPVIQEEAQQYRPDASV